MKEVIIMRKKVLFMIVVLFMLIATSCSNLKNSAILLKEPMTLDNAVNDVDKEAYASFLDKLTNFSSKLSEQYYNYYDMDSNLAISPLSIYMALALVTECSNGNTRDEILNGIGLTYQEVLIFTKVLYANSNKEYYQSLEGNKKLISKESLTNSIWFYKNLEVKDTGIQNLANEYYCYSYKTDFKNNNTIANQSIQSFIKDQTNGLINEEFNLSIETLITIINTLYLKDIWDMDNDLSYTKDKYDFKNIDLSIKSLKLLQGKYNLGKVYEEEQFTHFYTKTLYGYTLNFIIPKDGYHIEDVFTSNILSLVNNLKDYNAVDEQKKEIYYTRCLFPEFEASCSQDIKGLLKKHFGIEDLFNDSCDFSNIIEDNVCCNSIIHKAKLKVNKKGIEGAATTIVAMDGATNDMEYQKVYRDYLVDKSFGYILSDSNGVMLFSGVVHNV